MPGAQQPQARENGETGEIVTHNCGPILALDHWHCVVGALALSSTSTIAALPLVVVAIAVLIVVGWRCSPEDAKGSNLKSMMAALMHFTERDAILKSPEGLDIC